MLDAYRWQFCAVFGATYFSVGMQVQKMITLTADLNVFVFNIKLTFGQMLWIFQKSCGKFRYIENSVTRIII